MTNRHPEKDAIDRPCRFLRAGEWENAITFSSKKKQLMLPVNVK
jgi:hypothetical protein